MDLLPSPPAQGPWKKGRGEFPILKFAPLMSSTLRRLRRTLVMGFIILPARDRRLRFPSPCPVPAVPSGEVPAWRPRAGVLPGVWPLHRSGMIVG